MPRPANVVSATRVECSHPEGFIAATLEALPDAALLLDPLGNILLSNGVAQALLGVEAKGASLGLVVELVDGLDLDQLRALEGRSLTAEIGRRGQPLFAARLSAGPIPLAQGVGLVVVIHDLRERQQLELQLARARQLEVAGRVASGVAHDLNNLLSILSITSFLLQQATPDEAPELLRDIGDAIDRGSALTTRLLSLARRPVAEAREISVNEQLRSVEGLVRRTTSARVEICVELDPDAGNVSISPIQFDQVILNLAINADRAMPRGGRLTIRSARVDDQVRGPLVRVEIEDTGHGMSAKLQQRVFEPFFSTRAESGGTGLGLSIVRDVVEQAGGELELSSRTGEGTRFAITLPRLLTTDLPESGDARGCRAPAGLGPGRRAMLVDDEPRHLRSMARLLRSWGIEPILAHGPGEAMLVAERDPMDIAFALVDVEMPYMDGFELARRLGQLRDALPVLLISGANHDGDEELLRKPLNPALLASQIERALERGEVDP